MKSIKELRQEKGVLVAAHRGTSAGNIPRTPLQRLILP